MNQPILCVYCGRWCFDKCPDCLPGRALQADTDDEDPECDDASTDTGRGFNPTDTGNDASTDPTPKPEPKRQRTDTSAELCRPKHQAELCRPTHTRAEPPAAGRALQAETPVPTTVGDMLKAMRALEGPDPLEDLLE